MNKIIKLTELERMGACLGALRAFEAKFGTQVEVSLENVTAALEMGSSPGWLAANFLDEKNIQHFSRLEGRHIFAAMPRDCPQCRKELELFVELYNAQE